MARIGFGARGLVYLLVAAFATTAALGFGQQPHGIIDAVQAVTNMRLQVLLAGVIGTGLVWLALQLTSRSPVCGIAVEAAEQGIGYSAREMIGDALIYAVVMISILSVMIGWHPDGERQTQTWTAWILGQPFGRALVGVVGLLILTCGIGVIVWGHDDRYR